MNPMAELDQLNLEPAAKTELAALIRSLIEQVERDAKIIQAKELKIGALTHELAYYKRIRFSTKSEALAPLQRDVFEETWNTDISAIEAEVEQLQETSPGETVARPKRPRAGRQPLPTHLPRIEHRHEPESCTCGQCGRDLVKIGDDCRDAGGRATQEQLPRTSANNWMSSRPSFSCIDTFVLSMPVEPAKPSRRRRFRRR